MPGINASSSIPSSGIAHLSGPDSPSSHSGMSVSELKEHTKDQVTRHARGASSLSLVATAKKQSELSRTLEQEGDFRGAYKAVLTAAVLTNLLLDSQELKKEEKKGVLWKAYMDFYEAEGKALKSRGDHLEAKLQEFERSHSSTSDSTRSDTNLKSGGSLTDRLRALKDSGMDVSTVQEKRLSRDGPSPVLLNQDEAHIRNPSPTSPLSRFPDTSHSHGAQKSISKTFVAGKDTHTFVPASALGPPSPLSSPASSPRLSQSNVSLDDISKQISISSTSPFKSLSTQPNSPPLSPVEFSVSSFNQNFPSIAELDGFTLPAVPTTIPGTKPTAGPSDFVAGGASTNKGNSELNSRSSRSFPLPPVAPIPRPSSTPITPTHNTFVSRSPSPEASGIPARAGRAEPNFFATRDTKSSQPNHTIEPSDLYGILTSSMTRSTFPKIKTLLLDVRTRMQYELEHIRVNPTGSSAIICIEPSVLQRELITSGSIEDSLVVAPREDLTVFRNRDKFDLVVVYDQSSNSLDDIPVAIPTARRAPLAALVEAITNENRVNIKLRSPPVLLLGGLDGWRREIGDKGISRYGDDDTRGLANGIVPTTTIFSHPPQTPLSPASNAAESRVPSATPDPYQFWRPSPDNAATTTTLRDMAPSRFFNDPTTLPSRPIVANLNVNGVSHPPDRNSRPESVALSSPNSSYTRGNISDAIFAQTPPNGSPATPIQYPPSGLNSSAAIFDSYPFPRPLVSLPPQASVNPMPSRRWNDSAGQPQESLPPVLNRRPVDYPDLSSQHFIRLPPVAVTPPRERQDNRPVVRSTSSSAGGSLKPPVIESSYPVTYWPDLPVSTSGLKNLGNTCYMNATIQCLSASVPFARFFTDGRWKSGVNMVNPLGSKGSLAQGFSALLHELWHGDIAYFAPYTFRKTICNVAPQFGGSDQHDSQEFLAFLLDGLHEDLNRVLYKPEPMELTPEREAELEKLPQQIASDKEWTMYLMRNNSIIVDFFQGQYKNRLECLTCRKTSTTYNSFMYLTLPVPPSKGFAKVSLKQCLDNFLKEEVMEKAEAWRCPTCKKLRTATKRLSLARLPPVLLIHLKRFQSKGPFTDKIETFVDFPLKGLDLTNHMPPPLPPGVDRSQLNGGHSISLDDARTQIPPYKYDLYAVTNHYGSLSSGHYTAFIASRGGWLYCDDSSVKNTDAREVVSRSAYVLFYKRTRT